MIFTFIIFTAPCVWGQIVKRTTKAPTFFVPNGSLKAKTDAEKLSAIKKPAHTRGGVAHIEKPTEVSTAYYPEIQYEKAPIDSILKKQKDFSKEMLSNYRQKIVNSFAIYSDELEKLLRYEYEKVNQETLRMKGALDYIKAATPAYRLANYQLDAQISQDMVKSRKHYKKIKQKLAEIISEQKNKKVYIIEAKNNLFWIHYKLLDEKISGFNIKGNYHFKDVTYISIFDNKYNHLFSYNRQHINMLKNRRIPAADKTADFHIDIHTVNTYQQLFDDYINDLNRIGKGLDINNPQLLRQLDEMQDKTISI